MANYKVPQDVEAEDKLLGPLTFKQFIFMLIAAGAGLMTWFMYQISPFMAIIPLPFVLIFGGLAVLRREDQPIERYLLSFINYLIRPRQRVWNTEGYYDHLVITAPKTKAAPDLKSDIGQVKGQLEHLAQVVDTRGWAVKRPDLIQPGSGASATMTAPAVDDDRLFTPEAQQTTGLNETIADNEDLMDDTNPEAQAIDSLLKKQSTKYREETIKKALESAAKAADTTRFGKVVDPPKKEAEDKEGAEDTKPKAKEAVEKSDEKPDQEQDRKDVQTQDIPAKVNTDIMELSEMKISSIAAKVNRDQDIDNNIKEGEEVKLR